mmetsp:Transcript_13378/g.19262  ORF Transcript_13378/g.19262 Transcript_13378/m.19262 type:complete len:146 (+) Transcript_13378:2-439(+)
MGQRGPHAGQTTVQSEETNETVSDTKPFQLALRPSRFEKASLIYNDDDVVVVDTHDIDLDDVNDENDNRERGGGVGRVFFGSQTLSSSSSLPPPPSPPPQSQETNVYLDEDEIKQLDPVIKSFHEDDLDDNGNVDPLGSTYALDR